MSSTSRHQPPVPSYETSAATNTTFVRADPSNFRAVVQKLTGSAAAPLHERRQKAAAAGMMSMTKLEMMSNNYCNCNYTNNYNYNYNYNYSNGGTGSGLGLGLVSPVSTLDGLGPGGLLSPTTPELEHKLGLYLQTTTTSPAHPPKLLPLFPLHSPTSQHRP